MSALGHGEDTRRALAHIAGRTRQGSFAAPLYDWSAERWEAAVEPLEYAGVVTSGIAWAADDPTVNRGWVLADPQRECLVGGRTTVDEVLAEVNREQESPTFQEQFGTTDAGYEERILDAQTAAAEIIDTADERDPQDREPRSGVWLTDGVGEGADRNISDVDETPDRLASHRWSVEQARWVPDTHRDPAQYDAAQLARQPTTTGQATEPSHQAAKNLQRHQRQEVFRAGR